MSTDQEPQQLFFIIGRGLVGEHIKEILDSQKQRYVFCKSRMEDRESLSRELDEVKPTRVLLAAGTVGKPNVDWCEDHKEETIRGNVIGTINAVDICSLRGIHVTYYATGCIYNYDRDHYSVGFKETDPPNFDGSFYSKTKVMAEEMIKSYSNVLILRLRLPLTSDLLNCPRNLITKLLTYEKVVNIKNSITVFPELLPLSIEISIRQRTGIWNFTNPGVISHGEILRLYKEYIDPDFTWKCFTLEEQSAVLKAPRSNCFLDTTKLESEFPEVLPIKQSIIKYVLQPAAAKVFICHIDCRISFV